MTIEPSVMLIGYAYGLFFGGIAGIIKITIKSLSTWISK